MTVPMFDVTMNFTKQRNIPNYLFNRVQQVKIHHKIPDQLNVQIDIPEVTLISNSNINWTPTIHNIHPFYTTHGNKWISGII